jgi:peptidoglycan lytic transglycosylase
MPPLSPRANVLTPQPRLVCLLLLGLTLSACGSLPQKSRYHKAQDSAPSQPVDYHNIANAVPKDEPRSKYGNPKSYVVKGRRYTVRDNAQGFVQRGRASWYGTKFHGHRTSSGETYDMYAMTAAHKTLPLPVYVQVHNLDNDRKIIVRVNDRGPFASGRIIDLSFVAAKKLGITAKGTGWVEIRVVGAGASVANIPLQKANVPQAQHAAVTNSHNSAFNNTRNNKQLYLQVGAFGDQNNASQLLERLVASLSENVSINRKAQGKHHIYRVRIGPLRSEKEAQRLRQVLKPLGIHSPNLILE